jgi:glyoxylase-like metal-dependent hydrolase (beta-lactamase superfamily II)
MEARKELPHCVSSIFKTTLLLYCLIITYKTFEPMKSNEYFQVAPGVWGMRILFVNIYMVETGPNEWVLIDGGLYGSAGKIKRMAEALFGPDNPPKAIILTHGHFDHVGALKELIHTWKVQVYAHILEMPYLTGQSAYPPPDPSVGGGLMSSLSFLFPKKPIQLGSYVHTISKAGSLPYMPDWISIHTPGHAPGHISLFRGRDKVLIAGDAFVTTKQESVLSVMVQAKVISGPPKYFTTNWLSAALSVKKLRDLRPEVAATGHGKPMYGEELHAGLDRLVNNFQELAIPRHGRYVHEAAKANKQGVQYVPAAPETKGLIFTAFVISAFVMFGIVRKARR